MAMSHLVAGLLALLSLLKQRNKEDEILKNMLQNLRKSGVPQGLKKTKKKMLEERIAEVETVKVFLNSWDFDCVICHSLDTLIIKSALLIILR